MFMRLVEISSGTLFNMFGLINLFLSSSMFMFLLEVLSGALLNTFGLINLFLFGFMFIFLLEVLNGLIGVLVYELASCRLC